MATMSKCVLAACAALGFVPLGCNGDEINAPEELASPDPTGKGDRPSEPRGGTGPDGGRVGPDGGRVGPTEDASAPTEDAPFLEGPCDLSGVSIAERVALPHREAIGAFELRLSADGGVVVGHPEAQYGALLESVDEFPLPRFGRHDLSALERQGSFRVDPGPISFCAAPHIEGAWTGGGRGGRARLVRRSVVRRGALRGPLVRGRGAGPAALPRDERRRDARSR